APSHQGNVVGVGLNRQQHLSLVRLPFGRALDEHIARLLVRLSFLCIKEGGTGAAQTRRKNVATIQKGSAGFHRGSPHSHHDRSTGRGPPSANPRVVQEDSLRSPHFTSKLLTNRYRPIAVPSPRGSAPPVNRVGLPFASYSIVRP